MIHIVLPLVSYLVDIDQQLEVEELLNAAIVAFALVLLALSLTAFRKTRLKRLLIVSSAFGLFAVDVAIRQLGLFVFAVGFETSEVITTLIEFAILLLFFVAVARK